MTDRAAPLRFDRGSLRLGIARTARVPPYLIWDNRIGAWRTEALNYLRVREEAPAYRLSLDDEAPWFFECPTLTPSLPRLRPDQRAAVEA